ncbi:MAG: hypothetical protein OXI05_03125 [Bacteroidota bacterium]|nr:hypothetical protein [Bacteroidota bacterium]
MHTTLYLELDVHTCICVLAAMDSLGCVISIQSFPTSEFALVRHVLELPAQFKHLALEASSLAGWIASALRPHVTQLVVCAILGTIRESVVGVRMIAETPWIFVDFFDWGDWWKSFIQIRSTGWTSRLRRNSIYGLLGIWPV